MALNSWHTNPDPETSNSHMQGRKINGDGKIYTYAAVPDDIFRILFTMLDIFCHFNAVRIFVVFFFLIYREFLTFHLKNFLETFHLNSQSGIQSFSSFLVYPKLETYSYHIILASRKSEPRCNVQRKRRQTLYESTASSL